MRTLNEIWGAVRVLASFAAPDVSIGVGWQKRAMHSNKAIEAA